MAAGTRWFTPFEAANYVREQGKGASDADIRRAAAVGAIPGAEQHQMGQEREIWLIPQPALQTWIEAGLPARRVGQRCRNRAGGMA